jgi:hypothetical protein
VFLLVALPFVGCTCASSKVKPGGHCTSTAECPSGATCVDTLCVERPVDAGPDGMADSMVDARTCATPCGPAACCVAGESCVSSTCVRDGTACTTNADCQDDSRCDTALGACVAWADGASDLTCARTAFAGVFSPSVQCEFRTAPAGDPFPANVHVLATPMVADFRVGRTAADPVQPSIVAVFDDGVDGSSEQPTGVIRILDGNTCEQQAELGSLQLVSHSSPPAIGDLDGDGRPEIVANKAGGGLVAFGYDTVTSAWVVRWRSTAADGVTPYDVMGGSWAGPTLVDLDDDGSPEIMRQGLVFDASGRLRDESLAALTYSAGIFAIAVDVDSDGRVELVVGSGVYEWSGTTWTPEAYSTGGTATGHVALADFGDFPGTNAWPPGTPEVAVVSAGTVRVQTLDGTLVFGPVTLPGAGSGGPPTVGDFDGDGRPEIATAGASAYSVFDLDCTASPIGTCGSGRVDGVLWSQPAQDASSNVTGSSIFDFEGDGIAEAVYGDECFVRVYDGRDGTVLFSQLRSSCTWYENPVVADVDGDFNAEIVIGSNFNCGDPVTGIACGGLGDRSTDPIFAGLRCRENADCLSGVCDTGLCRCTADAECCSGAGCDLAGFVCVAPPTGTPGTGNTCRASRPRGEQGIRVYRDTADRWVNSRAIWNQHAYYVTNVGSDGAIPRTSLAAQNWADPELNNFRQNVQGDAATGIAPDLTGTGAPFACSDTGVAQLAARVCNRGAEPVGRGLVVGFYDADPRAPGATSLCRATTFGVLSPGVCETVTCAWSAAPSAGVGVTVWVNSDDDRANAECEEANNVGVLQHVVCPPIG